MIPFQEFAALLTARPLYRLDQITAWDALTLAISVLHPVSRATRTVLSAAVASHVRTSLPLPGSAARSKESCRATRRRLAPTSGRISTRPTVNGRQPNRC